MSVKIELRVDRAVAELCVGERRSLADVLQQAGRDHAKLSQGEFVGLEPAQDLRLGIALGLNSQRFAASRRALAL